MYNQTGAFVSFDMGIEHHTKIICLTCHYHLRNISATRSSLTKEATEKLVHAFISSQLDSCNALLYELPLYLLSKLQRMQNIAARSVARRSKHQSISSIMQ